ncbi:MAG: efflux transporter outer membrane subunit [Burkholderiales bacterium]|nr:efflux transporter outer membrane subunit [Burkholderiales bacterium]
MRPPGLPARALALAAGVTLAACTVGPDYVKPVVDTPVTWRIDYPKAAEVANTPWWKQFGDPVLDELIETTLRENRDIRIAVARIEQFAGGLQATRSQLWPQVGYGADTTRTRQSRVGTPPIPEPFSPYFTIYQGSLAAQWQIDLFGRVQRLSEAAQAQVYASEQAKRGVVLTLVAGVATSYLALRALDRQLEIATRTAANFGETKRIFELRYKAGLVSMTEVSQINSQYQQAQAAIPLFRQGIASLENGISVLTGRNPGPIPRGKPIDALVAPLIPADLPSAVLLRRPDILQAEQNLVAANANIGAAKALYFPTLSLTGLLGSVSTAFGNFLTGPATTWAVVAGVTGPIFTAGGIEGQVRSAEGGQRAALAFYQQTILGALRETNDALVGSQEKIAELAAQTQRVQALREFARLSNLRFDKGIASYLDVLVAENELFAAELANVRVLSERYGQIVAVYQAMGGGWVDLANSATPQPQGVAAASGR